MSDTDNLPQLWALDITAKAAGYNNWLQAARMATGGAISSIIAHARTLETLREALRLLREITMDCSDGIPVSIRDGAKAFLAKHEPEIVPVDPDLVTAREICARLCLNCRDAVLYRDGNYDGEEGLQFVLTKLKEARNV